MRERGPWGLAECTSRPSPEVLHACATFGLHAVRAERGRPEPDVSALVPHVVPGRVVLICGPSGGGKSTVLRALVRILRAGGTRVSRPRTNPTGSRTVLDLLSGTVERRMGVLARAGLGEARLLVRTPGELSEGQRSRFEIAEMLGRARPGSVVVIDEFCSTLDRITARGVARLVGGAKGWVRGSARVGFVCATAHDDIEEWLAPDTVAQIGLAGDMEIRSSPGEDRDG